MRDSPGYRHIVVVGLMGSGKTTVGTRIAGQLGLRLHDSDEEIEAREGETVRELRERLGVDGMHQVEARQLLEALATVEPSVVCPAASVVDVPACRDALADPSVAVVFLAIDPATAARRFITGDHRPWYGDDPATFLAEQAALRYPAFRALAPIEIDVGDMTADQVTARALEALAERSVLAANS